MLINPFTILLACLPLVGYLLLLGMIRVSGRTVVTSGARDLVALGIGISGLIAIGPIELFFPTAAATVFGPYVWIALAIFYSLCLSLCALTSQPRLVVYGRSRMQTYEALLKAAQQIDPAAGGTADNLQIVLPSINVRLRVDGAPHSDWAQVFAFEPNLNATFWNRLQARLRSEFADSTVQRNYQGLLTLAAAACLIAFMVWHCRGREELVVEGFRKWLWR
ncbi:hypothetical protein Q31b_12620 [Novipirellula aureliae]|uniref:Transmembrane protein n=1 Tax=Novipirellula aureliae TaxID=2527966 RepID=A0A5C6E267_9BACT|nr:hypothetical protein [Novipirellula aureliae]TWU43733.1 hypothetical protein Q31b_12620 [Novipirellula aureliae]